MTALLTSWPDEPHVYEREAGELDRVISPESIGHYLETGCVPADESAVVRNGAALHPDRHRTAGRTERPDVRNPGTYADLGRREAHRLCDREGCLAARHPSR
ncbi:hypothetical protein [Streptomyces sp. NPDC007346]|uniref:hypothetical protein n=1 Tax=Streptomyces sp. NPDC007346 TaxID=3154682 RepID=UPI003455F242